MSITTDAAQRLLVANAVEAFLTIANTHPSTLGAYGGYDFIAVPMGTTKYRIVMRTGGKDQSVHAFVDAVTGDLLKAAGWKVPAKGVRYNLLTEMDVVARNFTWSGGYLYAGARK